MLPQTLRNRRSVSTENLSKQNQSSLVKDTATVIKKLPVKAKLFLLCSGLLSLYAYYSIIRSLTTNHLAEDAFLETEKCPACYGHSLCWILQDNQIHLTGWSKVRLLDFVNVKNVHFGHHKDLDHPVVLKKLAHSSELQDIDERICKDAGRQAGCDVARVLHVSDTGIEIRKLGLLPKHLKNTTYMFSCVTLNLIDLVIRKYQEKLKPKSDLPFVRDKLQIYATALVNSEPLLLQTFPKSEGWPFPEYFGACGRFIAVEYCGEPLYNFYKEPFQKRADLAFQLLQMADKLTNTGGDFALYWTDLSYENFAVDSSGKMTIIDMENIIVVDRKSLHNDIVKPKKWDELHESTFEKCDDTNCLIFSKDDLCNHINSDHNYYAVCLNILSKYANEPGMGMPNGLLHDMPNYARDDFDLDTLLNECVHPHKSQGRIKAKDHLLEALNQLRNVKSEHDVEKGERI